MQPALDRAGVLAEACRNLANGQFLEIAQQHNFQIVRRQRITVNNQEENAAAASMPFTLCEMISSDSWIASSTSLAWQCLYARHQR